MWESRSLPGFFLKGPLVTNQRAVFLYAASVSEQPAGAERGIGVPASDGARGSGGTQSPGLIEVAAGIFSQGPRWFNKPTRLFLCTGAGFSPLLRNRAAKRATVDPLVAARELHIWSAEAEA